jgi:hypothetical protein
MEVENTAGKLPFDILCIIFEQYAKFDDRFTPLETLLLVSKSWHNTALHERRLWSSFEIHIRHIEDLDYWNACVTRRLNRCPPPVLFDIHVCIESSYGLPYTRACDTLLMQLAGESGEVARRWRRFVLNDPSFYIPESVLKRCLSFPTPNLEDIRLEYYYVQGGSAFLPDTSSLRIFHLTGHEIPILPNLANTTDLSICVGGVWGEFNEQAIAKATNLVTMKIDTMSPFKLTATYKQLRTLKLEGVLYKGSLSAFSAPTLTNLMLALVAGNNFHDLMSCKGINFGTLRKVYIRYGSDHGLDHEIPEYLGGVLQLLTAAINLELLVFEHKRIAHSIFKLLANDCQWLNQRHNLRVILYEGPMECDVELQEDRVANMDQVMKGIGCVCGYTTREE